MKALSIANTGAAVSRPSQILHASLEIEPAPHGIGKFCLLGRDVPSNDAGERVGAGDPKAHVADGFRYPG